MKTDGHQRFPPGASSRSASGELLHRPKVSTTRAPSTTPAASASSWTSRAQRSHDIVAQGAAGPPQPRAPRRLRLRGEHRRRRRHPVQIPRRVPARRSVPFALPAPGAYGAGLVFLPHDARDRDADQGAHRPHRRGGRPAPARLARRADRQLAWSAPARARREPVIRAGLHRRGGERRSASADAAARFERKLYVIRKRVENAVDDARRSTRWRGASFYVVEPVVATRSSTRACSRRSSSRPIFPDLRDPRLRVGAGAGPLALQHQHLPDLAAGASVPLIAHNGEINTLRGNINWMRARERLLQSRRVRRRPAEDPADHRRGRQRLGDVRQRARAAGAGGPVAAARDDDDDPRAVERPRGDEPPSGRRSTSTTPA